MYFCSQYGFFCLSRSLSNDRVRRRLIMAGSGCTTSCEARALQADDWPQLQAIEAQVCAHIDAAELLRANNRFATVNFARSTSCGGETTVFQRARSHLAVNERAGVDCARRREVAQRSVGHMLLGHWLTTLRNHFSGVLRKSPKAVPEPCRAAGVPTTKQSSRANRANCRSLALADVLPGPSHVSSR